MKKTRALTSWLLVVVMLTSLLTIPASAAEESAQLKFTYPETIVQEEVTVELYQGFPTSGSATLSKMIDGVLWPGEKIRYFGPSLKQTAEIAQGTYTQIKKNYPALEGHFFKTKGGNDTFELVTNLGSEFTISTMRGDNCHQVLCEEVGQEEQPLFEHKNYRNIVLPSVRLQHQVERRPDPHHIDFKKHYITSACRQQNEAYQYRCDTLKAMRMGQSAFILDIPWYVSVMSGIRTLAWADDLRRKLSAEEWMREMESGVCRRPDGPEQPGRRRKMRWMHQKEAIRKY